ncbi:9391_t:CDS:10 [Scutellospora calospora]|uniref:9391_t:CDS:1 n=1 Tax=Scutellospora calospora TaxID=85575 RepID=A0ACA9L7I9_9GLOM|nr:9391_t:CDS:10 [Scutellospora calospora]
MFNRFIDYLTLIVTAVVYWIYRVSSPLIKIFTRLRHEKTPEEKLRDELAIAQNYEEWLEKAQQLDMYISNNNDKWKCDPASPYYDYNLIQSRLDHLIKVREKNDISSMIYMLRAGAGLLRNLAGINDPRLFGQSYLGTKKLIEDYTQEVATQLEYINKSDVSVESPNPKVEFINDTRQSFGCSALVLYGGAAFGLCHLGIVKALHENQLLPRVICGTAVGAFIAALVCVHTDDELPPGGIDLEAFSKVGTRGNVHRKVARFLKHDCVLKNVGDLTFEEAYEKTKRVLNITVSSTRKFEVPQLLNYLTAPNVLISSAACASVAIMGLYDSYDLIAKDKTGKQIPWATEIKFKKWTDAVPSESESPLTRLSELFNVNHFIVSQANPCMVPFMSKEQTTRTSFLVKCGHFLSTEIKHRIVQLEQMHILPRRLRGIVDEKVSGDVTIVPSITIADFKKLFSSPTYESLGYWILKGEQSTWPLLALIRNRCMIELVLDRAYLKLKSNPIERVSYQPNVKNNERRKRTKSLH